MCNGYMVKMRGCTMGDGTWGPSRDQRCWMKDVGWEMQDRDVAGIQDENMAQDQGMQDTGCGMETGQDGGCRMEMGDAG